MKSKKHDRIVNDFEKSKSKHLERMADKMLKEDEKIQKLGELKVKNDIFKFFK